MTTSRRDFIKFVVAGSVLAGCPLDEALLALPLASGGRWVLATYDGSEGVGKTLTVTVTGEESVTVPAGTFACWKVEVTGNQIPFNYYVTKAAPYLLAKMEFVGQPVSIELNSHTP